ncbi:MAG: alanine dehydrogenase [Flavobacteriales bacterium]|nr:alanine dehydrogenase [Flavobacteriales bacterium]
MNMSSEEIRRLSESAALSPKEQLQAIESKSDSLFFGVPKETSFQERRVGLTPDAVDLLVNRGHRVLVETKAGEGSNFDDNEYIQAGAQIVDSAKKIFESDIIMKVAPPSPSEIKMLKQGQTLISALQLSTQPKNYLKALMDKKVTAISWDYIQDEEGVFPIVRSMSEIAGNTAILIAADLMSQSPNGKRSMFGGITGVPPTDVVIIGAGTVGEFAARAALGLGANVRIFDKSMYKLRRLQNAIGQRLNTCTMHPESLSSALANCDVAIGAVRSESGRSPCLVTEEMVNDMRYGSVIVDVSIDQGGCFETSELTTHEHPTVVKYGVIHYGVPNIPSRVSRTASKALSNIFAPVLVRFGEQGSLINVLRTMEGVRNGVYLYKGNVTSKNMAKSFDLPYKDIQLLLGIF